MDERYLGSWSRRRVLRAGGLGALGVLSGALLGESRVAFAEPLTGPVSNGAYKLKTTTCLAFAAVALGSAFCLPCAAQESGTVKPQILLQQIVEGMPRSEKQELRVLTASFKPGDKTVFHTHRFPVTVYVLEGAFTLEMEGRAPVTVTQGQAMVEPPHVKMTGYNRSNSDSLRVVVFYTSDPDTPFLDPLQ